MKIKFIKTDKNTIAEVISDEILIKTEQDALDLMANVNSQYIVLSEKNFEKDFFDLSTKKLGEVLQKFTNYYVNLAIIGNFDKFDSKALRDFIYESNKRGNYLFVSTIDQVTEIW